MEASGTTPEREVWEIGLWQLVGVALLVGLLMFGAVRLLGGSSSGAGATATGPGPAVVAREFIADVSDSDPRTPDANIGASTQIATPAMVSGVRDLDRVRAGLRLTTGLQVTGVTLRSLTPTRAVAAVTGTLTGNLLPGWIETDTVALTTTNGRWLVSQDLGSTEGPAPTADAGGPPASASPVVVARAFVIDEYSYDWRSPDAGLDAAAQVATPSVVNQLAGNAAFRAGMHSVTAIRPTRVTVKSLTPTTAVIAVTGTMTGFAAGSVDVETVALTRLGGRWKVTDDQGTDATPAVTRAPSGTP